VLCSRERYASVAVLPATTPGQIVQNRKITDYCPLSAREGATRGALPA